VELQGRLAEALIPPGLRPHWRELLLAARSGFPIQAELQLAVDTPGAVTSVQAGMAFDAATQTTLVTLLDVTERQRARARREAAAQASERSSVEKSRFLSDLSHEMRTPLNAVLGFSSLLLGSSDHPLDEVQRARIEHIQRAGRQLLSLAKESTDIARIESGRIGIVLAAVPVHELFAECLPLFEPDAQRAGVLLQALPTTGPGDRVRADPDRLRQVLMNLLSNAVKYNRRGGSVTLACRRDAANGTLDLVVADSGQGMDADQQARLFRPFDRLGAERTAVQGTGLGLTITRLLVEAMGGLLRIESQPAQGSVVTVTLPQAPPPVA
jgi:signal transduction histidine kinase